MKAAVFHGVKKPLTVEDIPEPEPSGPHDVVVRVARCGICGSDLHISEDPIFGVPAGVVLGHEYFGEVVATGPEVKSVKTGDLVSVNPLSSCGENSRDSFLQSPGRTGHGDGRLHFRHTR